MDMAANDTVDVLFTGGLHDGFFVIADVFDRSFRFVFQIGRQRPVPESEAAADAIEMNVQIENPIVKSSADAVQQPVKVHDSVELMTVQDEVALSIGSGMNYLPREHHAAETNIEEIFDEFVVIPGDVDDFGLLAAFPEQLLDENVVALLPMPFGFQLPAIDEIADEIKIAAFCIAQELQKFVDLRMASAEMDIRNPDRPVTPRTCAVRFISCDHKIFSDAPKFNY